MKGALDELFEYHVGEPNHRCLNRGDLHEDLERLPILADHFLKGAHMPFDAGNPMDQLLLVTRETGHGLLDCFGGLNEFPERVNLPQLS